MKKNLLATSLSRALAGALVLAGLLLLNVRRYSADADRHMVTTEVEALALAAARDRLGGQQADEVAGQQWLSYRGETTLCEDEQGVLLLFGYVHNQDFNSAPAYWLGLLQLGGDEQLQAAINMLDGAYSLLLLNKNTGQCCMITDRLGCHRLYYYQSANAIWFSADLMFIAAKTGQRHFDRGGGGDIGGTGRHGAEYRRRGSIHADGMTQRHAGRAMRHLLVDMAREKIVTVTAAADLAAAPAHDAFVRVEWDGARGVEVTYDKDKLSAGQVLAILQEQGLTLIGAISRAGSFNRLADRKRVTLKRTKSDGSAEIFTINVEELMKGESNLTWPLQPNDVINVPEKIL